MSFQENLFTCRKNFINDFTKNQELRDYLISNKDDLFVSHIVLHLSNTYIGKLSSYAKTLNVEQLKNLNNYELELWPEFYQNTELNENEKQKLTIIKNEELVKIINEMNFGKFSNIENYVTITILKNNIYKFYDKILFLFSDLKDTYEELKEDFFKRDNSAELKVIEWIKTNVMKK